MGQHLLTSFASKRLSNGDETLAVASFFFHQQDVFSYCCSTPKLNVDFSLTAAHNHKLTLIAAHGHQLTLTVAHGHQLTLTATGSTSRPRQQQQVVWQQQHQHSATAPNLDSSFTQQQLQPHASSSDHSSTPAATLHGLAATHPPCYTFIHGLGHQLLESDFACKPRSG